METKDEAATPTPPDAFLERHLPGLSPSVLLLRDQVAELNSSFNRDLIRVVLITGESGAGKNHTARVIAGHRNWLARGEDERADLAAGLGAFTGRFAEIPIPTLPAELVESELFGHKKGSFSGALKDHKGLLAGDADDILLDEIGDAPAAVQAKLLAVLETKRFRPVGGDIEDEIETSARLILATNHNLGRRVREGQFREDLFWRTTEYELRVPPVREQPENIPGILEYLLGELLPRALYGSGAGSDLREAPVLSDADMAWAAGYSWPGNIRQMRHALVRWLACNGRRALKEAATEFERVHGATVSPLAASHSLADVVADRLDSHLAAGSAVAGSPGELLSALSNESRDAIVRWCDDRRPSVQQLGMLFPSCKPTSMLSKLSQWRNR